MKKGCSILIIEGNIGSGKTTCMEIVKSKLEKSYNCITVQEPTKEWVACKNVDGISHLEAFYNNSRQEAFSFQLFAQMSRIAALKSAIATIPDRSCDYSRQLTDGESYLQSKHTVILVERSVASGNEVFGQQLVSSGLMSKCENDEIKRICKVVWSDVKTHVDTLFLCATPQTCMDRIKLRNRDGETVSLKLLEELNMLYDNFKDIYIINGDLPLASMSDEIDKIIDRYSCSHQ